MEKETQQPDSSYLKGFNEGYAFAKYMPELSEQLSKTEAKSLRMMGMQDGRKEYLAEVAKEKFPNWLKRDTSPPHRSFSKDKGKDIDRG